jgi:hypothetical protein
MNSKSTAASLKSAAIWIAVALIASLAFLGPFGGLSREAQSAAAVGLSWRSCG